MGVAPPIVEVESDFSVRINNSDFDVRAVINKGELRVLSVDFKVFTKEKYESFRQLFSKAEDFEFIENAIKLVIDDVSLKYASGKRLIVSINDSVKHVQYSICPELNSIIVETPRKKTLVVSPKDSYC